MKIIDRLHRDHADILDAVDRVEALRPFAAFDAIPPALAALGGLRDLLRRHEAFEDACLARFAAEAPRDRPLRHEIERVGRENDELLALVDGLMDAMGGLALRPAASWTDAALRSAEEPLTAFFKEIRGHIHRETVGLFFLALERLAEEIPASSEAP